MEKPILYTKNQLQTMLAGKLVLVHRDGVTVPVGMKCQAVNDILKINRKIEKLQSKKRSVMLQQSRNNGQLKFNGDEEDSLPAPVDGVTDAKEN
jgi:hypothetical protein